MPETKLGVGICDCISPNPYMGSWHEGGCPAFAPVPPLEFVEPTVGGLTGKQLSLLDEFRERNEDEARCAFIFFPADARGPEERCDFEPLDGSRFCEDHIPEPDWFDLHRDKDYE